MSCWCNRRTLLSPPSGHRRRRGADNASHAAAVSYLPAAVARPLCIPPVTQCRERPRLNTDTLQPRGPRPKLNQDCDPASLHSLFVVEGRGGYQGRAVGGEKGVNHWGGEGDPSVDLTVQCSCTSGDCSPATGEEGGGWRLTRRPAVPQRL